MRPRVSPEAKASKEKVRAKRSEEKRKLITAV
jgi:ribosomal protein L32